MDKKYSDSFIPLGIGASFILGLVIMIILGAITGYFLQDHLNTQRFGGIPLLIIFLVLLVGPMLFIRRPSRFEIDKALLAKLDGMGTIQGLRGAFFRLLIYEEGIEIRAFYHRYYIPFKRIRKISIQEGYIYLRLDIVSDIAGVPDYISAPKKDFLPLALLINKKVKS